MGFKNALFVVSQGDTYIVSIQQTVHSALLRGFEPRFATGSFGVCCEKNFAFSGKQVIIHINEKQQKQTER